MLSYVTSCGFIAREYRKKERLKETKESPTLQLPTISEDHTTNTLYTVSRYVCNILYQVM